MYNLYERLIDMLGKPPDDASMNDFIKELGTDPTCIMDRKSLRHYEFAERGLSIIIDKKQNQIKNVYFALNTDAVAHGSVKVYEGDFPAGISAKDDRNTVRQKLGLEPQAKRVQGGRPEDPKDYWDKYIIGPLELTFIFDGTAGRFDMLSVHYSPDNVTPEPPPPDPGTYIPLKCGASAIKAIELAQKEAQRLKHDYVGSESLLLGLIRDKNSMSARALKSMGVNVTDARKTAEQIVGIGKAVRPNPDFTPGAKRILEHALRQSEALQTDRMEGEHILLGLLEVGEGVGSRILELLNVDTEELRKRILNSTEIF